MHLFGDAVFSAGPVGQAGPAFVLEGTALSGRRELRAYFSGQDSVFGTIAIPLLTGFSILLGVLVRDPAEGFAAAAVSLAGLGAGLAMGIVLANVTSGVSSAMRLPVLVRRGLRLRARLARDSRRRHVGMPVPQIRSSSLSS